MVVDFPAPFGPRKPSTSPSLTEKDTPFTAGKSPKFFFRFLTSSIVRCSVCFLFPKSVTEKEKRNRFRFKSVIL